MTLAASTAVPPVVRPSARVLPLDPGDHLDQPTFHERYQAMPPGTRAELIGGVVFMPSPVTNRHGSPHGDLLFCLVYYRGSTPGVGTSDNGTTVLGEDSEPQPDAFMRLLAGGQTRLSDDDHVVGCPELVCEVANSSVSIDLHAKRRDYERYGAREYLAVVVRDQRLAWFVRDGDRLVEVPPDADGVYRSRSFPGFWVDPAALLRGDVPRMLAVMNQGLATPEHAAFAASLVTPPPPGAASGG